MAVGETPTFFRQAIKVWRFNFGRAVTAEIAITDVVGVNQNNVRTVGGCENSTARDDKPDDQPTQRTRLHGRNLMIRNEPLY
jgi:hypothetical protein